MDAKMGAAANNNDFEPSTDLIKEDECDTLLLRLPGFKKEQLRVQLARSGILRISGTRFLGENKWINFQKDFPVSENCEMSKVTAKFEGGILYVRQPKLIVPAKEEKDSKVPQLEVRQPHRIDENPSDAKKDEEQANDKKTTPHDDDDDRDQIKQVQEKIVEKKEEKSMEEEKRETGGVDDAEKDAERSCLDEKHENVMRDAGQNTKAKADDYEKISEADAVARLRRARQVMNFVLVLLALLVAFALGMYVNKPVSLQSEN